jgi:WD repeat-containing protein 35
MLAQRQLYDAQTDPDGAGFDTAMRTAMRLAKYEHILDPTDVQSLIALTSYYNGYFEQCSRAFTKLETADDCPQDKRDGFSDLAMDIFTSNAPSDPVQIDGLDGKWCIASGKPILEDSRTTKCKTCKRRALTREIRAMHNCPLCHSPIGGADAAVGGSAMVGGYE